MSFCKSMRAVVLLSLTLFAFTAFTQGGPPGEVRRHAWDDVHVYYSALSPNGRLYAAGGDSSCVRVWDLARGRQVQELVHPGWISHIAFTPDSKHLLSGSAEAVYLWDVATGKEIRRLKGLVGVALSPDGTRALSALPGGGLRCWEVSSGKEVHTLKPAEGVSFGRFSPDGKSILTWGGKSLRLWDPQGWESRVLDGPTGVIVDAWLLRSGKQVAALTGADHTLRLWDLAMGKEVRKLALGDDLSDIDGVTLCPDGRHCLSGHDNDNTIRVHDLMTGTECYRFSLSTHPRGLSISCDGRLALSGSFRGIVYLLRMPRTPIPAQPHDGHVYYLVNAGSGRCLAPRDGSAEENIPVVHGPWFGDSGGGERWRLQKDGDGYLLVNTSSFWALTAARGEKAAGTKVIQQSGAAPPRPYQQWRFTQSAAYYCLESLASGLRLTPANADLARDSTLTVEAAGSQLDQRWILAEADPEPAWEDPDRPASFHGCPKKIALLVVAPQRFRKALGAFLRHKSATGMPAWAVTLETVVKDFPGVDDPERIKRAIEYAHRLHGATHVMLAGDCSVIPVRYRCVNKVRNIKLMMDRGFQPADIYYANQYTDHRPDFRHDGHFSDWDHNGNGCHNESVFEWGEPAWGHNPDNVDTCPDVALGRVPAHTAVDLEEYLQRVIRHETSHQNPGTFAFFADKNYDGGIDMSNFVIGGLDGLKLAASVQRRGLGYGAGDSLPGEWKAAGDGDLAEAAGSAWWISYIGHGWQLGWNHPSADAGRILQLSNRDHWPIVFATACETGKMTAAPPWGRYRDVVGHIYDFGYDEDKGTAWDGETGKALDVPFHVPRPHPYDFLSAREQMVACAWLHDHHGGGAIAYFGEVIVQPDDMGRDLQRWMMERLAAGGVTLGDLYLTAQRRYWLEHHTDKQGDFHRSPRHYLCTTNLYGDPSLRLRRVAPRKVAPKAEPTPAAAIRPPEVFQDFESGSYGRWKRTGSAFGSRPASGALPDQNPVTGFGGKFLVNTFNGGDAGQGTLTSPPFTIHRPYITFRIGGGSRAGVVCMNLLIDGRPVRSSTGKDNEHLEWDFWEVDDLQGKTAVIQIVDRYSGGWGHLNVDDIRFADTPPLRSQTVVVAPALRGELRAFQGKWAIVATQSDGQRTLAEGKPKYNLIQRNRITSLDGDGNITQEATLVIVDPRSYPRKLKLIIDPKYVSAGAHDVFQAIYRLDDTMLTWCGTYTKGKAALPKQFSTRPGDSRFLLEMKRAPQ